MMWTLLVGWLACLFVCSTQRVCEKVMWKWKRDIFAEGLGLTVLANVCVRVFHNLPTCL